MSKTSRTARNLGTAQQLKLLEQLGISLAGFPDVVLPVAKALKKSRGGQRMAQVFLDGYNAGQRSLDMEYMDYEDWRLSDPLRLAQRKALIRLASSLPAGSPERRVLISRLKKPATS